MIRGWLFSSVSDMVENIFGSFWETFVKCRGSCSSTFSVIILEVTVGPSACSLFFAGVKCHHGDLFNSNDVSSSGAFAAIERFKRGCVTVENANEKCTWDALLLNIREELLIICDRNKRLWYGERRSTLPFNLSHQFIIFQLSEAVTDV